MTEVYGWRRLDHGKMGQLNTLIISFLLVIGASNIHSQTTHTIGLLAYVDYGLWKQWRQTVTTNEEAVYEIEYYFAHLITEINNHYTSLSQYNLSISIVLQGLQIATTPDKAEWSQDNVDISTGSDLLNGDQALLDLGSLVNTTKYQMYDVVVGFTGYNLFKPLPDGRKILGKIGSSILGGLCSSGSKVAIVEDGLNFMSAIGASHEIAHMASALHDGDGNPCSSASQFIMASAVENVPEVNVNSDSYRQFSSCTANYIATFINMLQNSSTNCLLDTPQTFFLPAVQADYLNILPGQRKQLDAQCRIALGPASFYCGKRRDIQITCSHLTCFVNDACFDLLQTRVFDGTSCGDNQWCIHGQCVYNVSAPLLDEVCPYGDYKLTEECHRPDIAKFCYNPENRMLCCETCARIKTTIIPGCEYGDRLPQCTTAITPYLCYLKNNARTCCNTCGNFERAFQGAPAGCKYGDHAPVGRCHARHCTTNFDTCCGTCTFGEGYPFTALRNGVGNISYTLPTDAALVLSLLWHILIQRCH